MTETQSPLTAEQRANILKQMRAGISIPAAAADVGADVVAALRDEEIREKSPEAYAVGSARLEKIWLEAAITKGDPTSLAKFLERRDAETQKALAELKRREEDSRPSFWEWLVLRGMEPPEGYSAERWFVSVCLLAHDLLEQAHDPEFVPFVAEVNHALIVVKAVGYDVVAKDDREEYAEEVLAAVYNNCIEEFERE